MQAACRITSTLSVPQGDTCVLSNKSSNLRLSVGESSSITAPCASPCAVAVSLSVAEPLSASCRMTTARSARCREFSTCAILHIKRPLTLSVAPDVAVAALQQDQLGPFLEATLQCVVPQFCTAFAAGLSLCYLAAAHTIKRRALPLPVAVPKLNILDC
jgi:hypothetical protein